MSQPNKNVITGRVTATGEFSFIDLLEVLRTLGCISDETYYNANWNQDFEGENYN